MVTMRTWHDHVLLIDYCLLLILLWMPENKWQGQVNQILDSGHCKKNPNDIRVCIKRWMNVYEARSMRQKRVHGYLAN